MLPPLDNLKCHSSKTSIFSKTFNFFVSSSCLPIGGRGVPSSLGNTVWDLKVMQTVMMMVAMEKIPAESNKSNKAGDLHMTYNPQKVSPYRSRPPLLGCFPLSLLARVTSGLQAHSFMRSTVSTIPSVPLLLLPRPLPEGQSSWILPPTRSPSCPACPAVPHPGCGTLWLTSCAATLAR